MKIGTGDVVVIDQDRSTMKFRRADPGDLSRNTFAPRVASFVGRLKRQPENVEELAFGDSVSPGTIENEFRAMAQGESAAGGVLEQVVAGAALKKNSDHRE